MELCQSLKCVGSCKNHESRYLDDMTFGSTPIEVIADILDNEEEHISSAKDINYEAILENEVVLNEIIVGGTTWKRTNNGLTINKLSKIWKIDKNSAEKTIRITTQHCVKEDNPALSYRHRTNDRML